MRAGLHFHLVNAPDAPLAEVTATYEAKAWQKVETWSEGLPPNGTWTVNLSLDDIVGMGVLQSKAPFWAGTWTWTFQNGKAVVRAQVDITFECEATYKAVDDFVRFTYADSENCHNEVDDMQWRLDGDGLHLHLIAIQGAALAENKAYLEAKPWQKMADQ